MILVCISDQGQVIKYFCRISLVMYLAYYNYMYLNAGPECQARRRLTIDTSSGTFSSVDVYVRLSSNPQPL